MLCREIIDVIEQTFPKSAALSWDNVGLLVGRMDKEVSRVYIAVDVTDEVIEDAIAKNVDMLITHHPMIFSPLKKITDGDFIGARVIKLLQHDISYYAMHTNYDVLGMADLAAEKIGLCDATVLEETLPETHQGIGKVGFLKKEMSLKECCEVVRDAFSLQDVKVFGDISKNISRVAISPGSGKSMIDIALAKGADVLITGDIGHHEGIDAVAQGLAIVDAGHYGLEHIFVDDVSDYLKQNIENIIVERAKVAHPFQTI